MLHPGRIRRKNKEKKLPQDLDWQSNNKIFFSFFLPREVFERTDKNGQMGAVKQSFIKSLQKAKISNWTSHTLSSNALKLLSFPKFHYIKNETFNIFSHFPSSSKIFNCTFLQFLSFIGILEQDEAWGQSDWWEQRAGGSPGGRGCYRNIKNPLGSLSLVGRVAEHFWRIYPTSGHHC